MFKIPQFCCVAFLTIKLFLVNANVSFETKSILHDLNGILEYAFQYYGLISFLKIICQRSDVTHKPLICTFMYLYQNHSLHELS